MCIPCVTARATQTVTAAILVKPSFGVNERDPRESRPEVSHYCERDSMAYRQIKERRKGIIFPPFYLTVRYD